MTDRYKLTQALVVDPLYLQHSYSESAIDYRVRCVYFYHPILLCYFKHWGIPLSRRFRSLKLWFVIRNFGVSGLQEYVRNHCRLAKVFEAKVEADTRFRVMNDVKVSRNIQTCHWSPPFAGRTRLLPPLWLQPAEPEAADHHKCFWQTAHGNHGHHV